MKVGEFDIPDGLKYSAKHQWAKVEGSNIKIGITDFAKKSLKEIVFVEFIAQVGDAIDAGSDEPIATIESTKAVGEIFAPVSGEIVEVNTALEDDPDPNLSDPYVNGWMYLVNPSKKDADMGNLLDAAAYAEVVKKESG
ncbi:MAG TPA: glycine cleavage system H protein [Candidatus Deferrimicrobium sp.]|nr:glycine cleavage system H protein [Candidatus Deferrimicrobium sp.]